MVIKCPECLEQLRKDELAFGVYHCNNCKERWVIMTVEQSMNMGKAVIGNIGNIEKFALDMMHQNNKMKESDV